MTVMELAEEIEIELEMIGEIVKELAILYKDVGGRTPTVREKTAASAFLAQFYNGIENILKRLCRYYAVPLPHGDTWHIELFKLFCETSKSTLPVLFDDKLANAIAPYRKFRHVVYHSYGFQLDWQRMVEGIEEAEKVFQQFRKTISSYLDSLQKKEDFK